MGPQVQPKCFRHLQHMRNNWELRKRGYLIRFGHTEALLLKKRTLNGHFSRPAETDPYVHCTLSHADIFVRSCRNQLPWPVWLKPCVFQTQPTFVALCAPLWIYPNISACLVVFWKIQTQRDVSTHNVRNAYMRINPIKYWNCFKSLVIFHPQDVYLLNFSAKIRSRSKWQ